MSEIAKTTDPPYYAVIFTSQRTEGDHGYSQTAERMVELASRQPGFLGVELARTSVGITVSYWSDSTIERIIFFIPELFITFSPFKWVIMPQQYNMPYRRQIPVGYFYVTFL